MGLFDSIVGAGKAVGDRKAAEKTAKSNKQARQQGMDMVANQDWQPELASDHIAPYQRAQSPVADAFLSSFLTGSNPAAVQSTRAGSGQQKAQAQQAFDRGYGGWDKLRADQAALEQSTPWAVKPFTQPAVAADSIDNAKAPGLTKYGLTPDDGQLLKEAGLSVDPMTGRSTGNFIFRKPQNLAAAVEALKRGDEDEAFRLLDAKPHGLFGSDDR